VGVVIPTFDRVELTIRAVTSVLSQTHKASQILVVDDGSSESSLEQLAQALKDLPVNLVSIPHSGNPGLVRKVGISHLQTRFVSFLDSDDFWLPTKLELQLKILITQKARAVCSNAWVKDNVGMQRMYFTERKKRITFNKLIFSNTIICSTTLVERDLINKCGGFADAVSVQGAEDYATWLRVALEEEWVYIEEPLIAYSVESIDHFSHGPHRLPELQALIDLAVWRRTESGKFPKLFQIALKFLRLSLLDYGKKR